MMVINERTVFLRSMSPIPAHVLGTNSPPKAERRLISFQISVASLQPLKSDVEELIEHNINSFGVVPIRSVPSTNKTEQNFSQ